MSTNGHADAEKKEESRPLFHLHSYFRSSCSGRLRIACNLKKIPVSYTYINLLKNDQSSSEYIQVNPSKTVPTLTPIVYYDSVNSKQSPSGTSHSWPITQSIAALEYLEEVFPDRHPLLPPPENPTARAQVRVLVGIIASDIQPVTNLRILKRVKRLSGDPNAWGEELMTDGFSAYEKVLQQTAGTYSVGDHITLADVCLVPAVWGAQRVGVDFDKMPLLKGVFERLSELDEVKKAHWQRQEDTPEDLRG